MLSVFVDFNSFLSDSSTLRIAYAKAQINGISSFNDKNIGGASITANMQEKEFTTDLQKISMLVMQEKGYYWGAEYTSFETPSAVGFSGSSKNIEYYGLDPSTAIKNYALLFGYDTAAYAKRYESDFSSFYLQGLFGIGVSTYSLSREFKHKIERASNKSIKSSTYSFVFDAELEFGYIWQQRFQSARGLGYSIELGAKARGIYTGVGQSDESDSTIAADKLQIEMQRYDVWYGPYAHFNIVF